MVRTLTAIAEPLQRRLEEQHHSLKARILAQQFECELRSAPGINQLAVAHFVPASFSNRSASADFRAPLPDCRQPIGIGGRETSAGTSARTASRISNSRPAAAARGQLGAVEIAADAVILIEENLLVHLLGNRMRNSARGAPADP
jgi:hypothetical protein